MPLLFNSRTQFLKTTDKKNQHIKGTPVVKLDQDASSHDWLINLFGFNVTYQWFLVIVGGPFAAVLLIPFAHIFYREEFGYNFSYIVSILLFGWVLEYLGSIILSGGEDTKTPKLTPTAWSINFYCFWYAMTAPLVMMDSKWWIYHSILILGRDSSLALLQDFIRLYLWPDNELNRKRIANFDHVNNSLGWHFWFMMAKTPFMRILIEHFCVVWYIVPDRVEWSWVHVVAFPCKMFIFEVVGDFTYYWFHRSLHESIWLYKTVHKLHHTSKTPTGLNASTMSYVETAATFMVFDWLTPLLMGYMGIVFTSTEWALIAAKIVGIEIAGHSGHIVAADEHSYQRLGTCFFSNLLGIRLDPKDHELHHWHNTVNYSKRTAIWDKLFNTYDYWNVNACAKAALETKTLKPVKQRS